jgi:NACHT domain
MAEALALGAGIIAVIQLADRVICLSSQLTRFIGHVRNAKTEIAQVITTIIALKGTVEFLQQFVKNVDNASRLPQLGSISQPDGPLSRCRTMLEELESEMQAGKDDNGILKAISWPWKGKEIGKVLQAIEKQKTLIMLALLGDTAQSTLAIESAVKDIKHTQGRSRKDILTWLTKVDPASNHTAACEKHEPGTGEWFINSHEFSYWLLPGRSLWLHGIPGAGKTVLCSTIIENVMKRCSPESHCLYFYFDFSDSAKQKVINMLYSFLSQLSINHIPSDVRKLYEVCGDGAREATVTQLTTTLLSITRELKSVYIIVDALDESSDRGTLPAVIRDLCQSDQINMLITSRHEQDLKSALTELMDYIIPIQNECVDVDIRQHVERCLRTDRTLCLWNDTLKATMTATLVSKAHGM